MKAPTTSLAMSGQRDASTSRRAEEHAADHEQELWGLELWRRRIWGRDARQGSSFQRSHHAHVQQVRVFPAQTALAAESNGARRKRLTAFRQHRRFARVVFDRLRRMGVMIAGRHGFMVRSGRRARGGSVFDAHGVRPSRAQVDQRSGKKERNETTKSHSHAGQRCLQRLRASLHVRCLAQRGAFVITEPVNGVIVFPVFL